MSSVFGLLAGWLCSGLLDGRSVRELEPTLHGSPVAFLLDGVSSQPSGCCGWRWWCATNREACTAAGTTAIPQPRRQSWEVTYTGVPRVSVSVAAIASWSLARRPVTRTVGGPWAVIVAAAEGAGASRAGEGGGGASGRGAGWGSC